MYMPILGAEDAFGNSNVADNPQVAVIDFALIRTLYNQRELSGI